MTFPQSPNRSGRKAFTLVELLVATAILMLMLGFLLTVTNNVGSTVVESSAKLDAYASGRAAFDIVANTLSRATLNTYWTYYNAQGQTRSTGSSAATNSYVNFVPVTYGRASNLQFVVRTNVNETAASGTGYWGQEVDFSYPAATSTNSTILDTQGLLNNCSFFVQYGNDFYRPAMFGTTTTTNLYRYRLFESMMDTTNFQYFVSGSTTLGTTPPSTTALDGNANWRPLADNVIALIVWPQDPEDPSANTMTDPAGNPVISGTELQTNSTGQGSTGSGYTYDSQYPYGYTGYSGIWGGGSSFTASSFPITFCQSPPTVQLTLVLIDEASAKRLCTGPTPPTVIENALSGKFVNPVNYNLDLYGSSKMTSATVTGTYGLINYLSIFAHVNCQVLSTKIVIRESKWSK